MLVGWRVPAICGRGSRGDRGAGAAGMPMTALAGANGHPDQVIPFEGKTAGALAAASGGMQLTTEFLPIARMLERANRAKEDSDTSYFFDLLYVGESLIKLLTLELLAALQDDRQQHRYSLEYRLVRANSIGEWADVLDEALTGPASQLLVPAARDSQRALSVQLGPSEYGWQRDAVNLLNEACRCVDSTVTESSRQKITFRQWVRQFVWLRNRTRGHGAPRASTLSKVCPKLEASLMLIIGSAPAFSRSWAYVRRNLSGKYRVSGFGGDRSAFSKLTKESNHGLSDGTYIYQNGYRPVRLLFTDPDLTDFFLPNGNFQKLTFEVLSYVSDERRSEDGSKYVLPVQAQPVSETTARPQLDVIGNSFSNMPPRRSSYVRRGELERELADLLRDSRHPVVTLHGRGGVGKTSLALEVLHGLADENNFFAIIWFSARDIDLLPEGPRVVKADVVSTEDVAKDFAQLMVPEKPLKLTEAQKYLTDCLSGEDGDGPFLFVLDNFETIREQAELYSYLSNAVRLPNKVLITTRSRDFKADYPVEVGGMTRSEFSVLVSEVSARLNISNLIDSSFKEDLFEESDGHPYIAKVLLGEVASMGKKASLKRVIAGKDAMLDALFDRSFAALSPAGQRVFLTLCSWRSLVPRIGLEAVLLRPGNERLDIERALTELQQLSLVETTFEEATKADYLSVPLAAALFGRKKLVTSPLKIAIEADLELIRGFGATSTIDLARGLGPRVDRLVLAIASREGKIGDLSQEFAVIEYIASSYPPAWLNLADLYQDLGYPNQKVITAINRYLEARPGDQEAWKRLIQRYRTSGDPVAEMHARLQLAEIARPPYRDLSESASRLNRLLSRKEIDLNADERRLIIQSFRRLMEVRADEADATDLSRLAWLCMYDQDADAANHWVVEGLEREPGNQHCESLRRRLGDSLGKH
ncbi:NB-ARC domain-containing protein [Micromonospora avicenniae]|uniref:NB-ARC domain-containing protein n=1 Tax=Micromonospora avicenniae TaxID=1198245 RepID=A0A1N7F082_9ACTN|nr:ATP-binding protein [Micromonospora avicenniae]SIR93730.1 NB-ARC domain-containing protein [Micromonospora avicenniae]